MSTLRRILKYTPVVGFALLLLMWATLYSPFGCWMGETRTLMLTRDVGFQERVPFPLVLTIAFPVAISVFINHRFRLWHYLAFTALVAVELAYYLRWQK